MNNSLPKSGSNLSVARAPHVPHSGYLTETLPSASPQAFTFAELIALLANEGDDNWLVPHVFRRRGIHLLTAPPATAKSWLMAFTARCFSTGESWFGRSIVPSTVLWLDGEMSATESLRRFNNLDFQPENERFFYSPDVRHRLDNETERNQLTNIILETGAEVVILDSFIRFHSRDENSNAEMSTVFRHLKEMQTSTGCSFFILHHTTKSGANDPSARTVRGAGDIVGMVDVAYGMAKIGDLYQLSTTKNRYVPDSEMLNLTFALEGGAGEPVSLREVDRKERVSAKASKSFDDLEKAITSALSKAGKPLKKIELGTFVKKDSSSRLFSSTLKRMVNAVPTRLFEDNRGGSRGCWYWLPGQPPPV